MNDCIKLPWAGWGEDLFLEKCMEMLGAQAKNDFTLVGDHRCMPAECEDISRASFHDYKSELLYLNCWNRSRKSEENQKTAKQEHVFCCGAASNHQDPCNSCNFHVSGYCGFSKNECHACNAKAWWCRRDNHSKSYVRA